MPLSFGLWPTSLDQLNELSINSLHHGQELVPERRIIELTQPAVCLNFGNRYLSDPFNRGRP